MNNHYPQQQPGSGLTRYRSAPSSFFDTLLDSSSNNDDDVGFGNGIGAEDFDHVQLFNPPASSSIETHGIFSDTGAHFQSQSQLSSQFVQLQPHDQQSLQRQKSSDYSSTMFNTNNDGSNSDVENALFGGSMNSNRTSEIKMEEGGGLIRHNSSPAGFFANLDIEKEFGTMRGGMENVGPGNSSNADASFSPAIRFKRNIDFSSKNSSPLGKRCTIENNPGQRFVEDRSNGGGDNVPGFSTTNSWNNSAMFSDDFFEGLLDNNDEETFTNANVSDTKNNGGKRHTTLLSHRSLPVNSSEFYAMENLLEDSVPCKTRAKRGFATHPRSIAERVRRTKISDRIKRLEDLVPNMEKQTNTADMLDLAVDYIKDLQRQVKKLSDNGAKCACLGKDKS